MRCATLWRVRASIRVSIDELYYICQNQKHQIKMKTEFTKQYILENRGCYSTEQVEAIPSINAEIITLQNLFDELPTEDFRWWLAKKCELPRNQQVSLAIHCAEFVIPIYEKEYPNDSRVRDCVQAVKDFELGKINRDELLEKHAADAADAADAAYTAAAYTAAADAAYAAYAYAAAYAAYADAAYAAAYRQHILNWIKLN